MMRLIRELHREHAELRAIVDCMDAALTALETGEEEVDFAELAEAMYFMTEYRDIVHHTREALLLRLLARRQRRLRSTVRDLDAHHDMVKTEGTAFLELLEDAAEDAIVSRAQLLTHGRRYCVEQREHLRRLETSVLPQAERQLGADDWRAIAEHRAQGHDATIERLAHEQLERLHRHLPLGGGRRRSAGLSGA